MERTGINYAVYADGHHSVKTSNHKSILGYLSGNAESLYAFTRCKDTPLSDGACFMRSYLHTDKNIGGFIIRRINGSIAAENLHKKIKTGEIVFDKEKDVIEVVAHSMGYAYAVGMIMKLAELGYKFGNCYILAPENACSFGASWGLFDEVWQYGSNLGEEDEDPPYLQDGVAPQCKVVGLPEKPTDKRGRVFIPKGFEPKGYLASHSVANYTWIFNRKSNERGYIKRRN